MSAASYKMLDANGEHWNHDRLLKLGILRCPTCWEDLDPQPHDEGDEEP